MQTALPGHLSPGTDTDAINFIRNDNVASNPGNMSNQHAKTSVKNDGLPFHSGLFGVSRYKLTTKFSKKDHCEIVCKYQARFTVVGGLAFGMKFLVWDFGGNCIASNYAITLYKKRTQYSYFLRNQAKLCGTR
jgi:hypothetical protein